MEKEGCVDDGETFIIMHTGYTTTNSPGIAYWNTYNNNVWLDYFIE